MRTHLFLAIGSFLAVGCGDASAPGSNWGDDGSESQILAPNTGAPQGETAGDPGSQPGAAPGATTPAPPPPPPPPPTTSGSFKVTLDKTSGDIELRAKTSFTVTVTPEPGFTGAVALTSKALPSGANATFAPASLDLSSGAKTAVLTIETLSTAQVGATNVEVNGISGAANASASVAFTVKPMITISVLKGEAGVPDGMGFGGGPITIKVADVSAASPVKVLMRNDDTVPHRIHASGTSGFVHGANPIPPGGADPMRSVTAKGNYTFYLHGETPEHRTTLQIQ